MRTSAHFAETPFKYPGYAPEELYAIPREDNVVRGLVKQMMDRLIESKSTVIQNPWPNAIYTHGLRQIESSQG